MATGAELDFAQLDWQRRARTGIAEAVYAPGKTAEQCVAIISELLRTQAETQTATREQTEEETEKQTQNQPPTEEKFGPILLSRPDETQLAAVLAGCPGGTQRERLMFWNPLQPDTDTPAVVIASAGTGDLPIAKECAGVLEAYGIASKLLTDIGVAGIHRTLAASDCLRQARAVVVVAGMEGALASVVGGLTSAPIVAVPSSVGYGTSLEGVTALLAMLSSCSPGITAVGIDNGFGAACAILRILNQPA